jgi:hypothetical protein
METDTWIDRTIIQVLSHHDKRYKHNYGGKKASTEELIADCAHQADVTSEGPLLMFDNLPEQHAAVEEDVKEAAERLHEQGLLTKVGERPIRNESGGEEIGTTSVWEPTEEGLAEVKRLNEAYAEAVDDLVEAHDDPENISVDDVRPILREFGVILDRLPQEFFERGEDE